MIGKDYVSEFGKLARAANDAGLLNRRHGFYWAVIASAIFALSALMAAVVLVGQSWWQLLVAAGIGVVMAQLGFLGHEAAHQEMFRSPA